MPAAPPVTPPRPHPVIIMVTAVIAAVITALTPAAVPALGVIVGVLYGVPAILWDIRHHILPDYYTYPLAAGAAASGTVLILIGQAATGITMLLTGGATAGVYLILALVSPMGLGDAKLAAGAAAFVGYYGWLPAAAAFILTYVAALPQALYAVWQKQTMVALGPAILAAAAGVHLWNTIQCII